MEKLTRFLFYCFLLFLSAVSIAQSSEVSLQAHPIEIDGFDEYWITALAQDQQGFLWIAGSGGLFKYDGYEYQRFKNILEDSTSLVDDHIEALYVDHYGILWVGTSKGVNRYIQRCDCFARYQIDKNDQTSWPIRDFAEDMEKNLWLLDYDGGLFTYDRTDDRFSRILGDSLNSKLNIGSQTLKLTADQQNQLWIGSGQGLYRFTPSTQDLKKYVHHPLDSNSLLSNQVWAIKEDRQGRILIGTSKSGLHVYNPKQDNFSRLSAGSSNNINLGAPLGQERVWGMDPWVSLIEEDQKGGYWIATIGEGINHFDPKTNQTTFYNSGSNGVEVNMFWTMMEDQNGIIWIGTVGGGLYKLDPSVRQFTVSPEILASQEVFESPINEGTIWAASNGNGLFKINQKTNQTVQYLPDAKNPNAIHHNWVRSVYQEDKSCLWLGLGTGGDGIGAGDGGLDRLDLERNIFTHYNIRGNDRPTSFSYTVYNITSDNDGRLWMDAGLGGLFRSNINKTEFYQVPLPAMPQQDSIVNETFAFNVLKDAEGSIWVGDGPSGRLFRYDAQKDQFILFLEGFLVTNFLKDENGWYWLSTWQKGILHLNPSDGTYTQYTTKDGMPSNEATYIVSVEDGFLWIGTRNGPAKIDLTTKEVTALNFINRRYNFGGFRSSDGGYYFYADGGLLHFYPDQIKGNPSPPKTVVTRFLVSGKPYPLEIGATQDITLSHDQNDLSIEYVGLHYSDPNKNKYQYKLTPADDDWIEAGSERIARYANLNPAHYTFQVKAANSDGVWNEESTTLKINIKPPWYQTWWAYSVFVLGVVGSVFGYIRYRSQALLKENKRLEENVAIRTLSLKQKSEELEQSLITLKSTQAQLIQSEKMASLGELTAGIAHEIQNPLNFVNNFSEVSTELLHELQEELEKGDLKESKLISNDVIQNLEKITHHGKRAENIVKGMLQHSRSGDGKRTLTNINQLADEYLRLSFHGLRAKDKTFNCSYETDFDSSIPDISIVAQDVGRVLLNLFNNAFQAVSSRQAGAINGQKDDTYKPMVRISTKQIDSPPGVRGIGKSIQISIKDNGPGIPEKIKDKIFQPFFTTKPTGHGTGLGLSLAFDIVNAHGGEIRVESEEKVGTEFLILLPGTKNHI